MPHFSMPSATPKALEQLWLRLRSSQLAINSAYAAGSQLSIALMQALQFVLLASALGPEEFGRFAAVAAITSALIPLSAMGLGDVSVMRIARGASARMCLGNVLAATSSTGLLGLGLALLIATTLLSGPETWRLVLLLGISEILMSKIVDVSAQLFYGQDKHQISAFFNSLHAVLRLSAAAALWTGVVGPTAMNWAALHLSAGLLSACAILSYTIYRIGRPDFDLRQAIKDARIGVYFAVIISARSVQTDSDKAILTRNTTDATAGIYTAAFRVAFMACMPIFACVTALQARLFRRGARDGMTGTLEGVRQVALIAGCYCSIIGAGLYIAAPAAPWVLGKGYEGSVDILRWLCLLPFFITFQSIFSAALSGAGDQRRLALVQSLAAVASISLNLMLVPAHGWPGAVMAAYGSQTLLLLGLFSIIWGRLSEARRNTP
ncbi:lipopolysaccharide biosynthesis protein [Ramlibacter sp. AN1015]|uniref:lipopolysaccharide biosynthesis protein n=1 Tax=Ramlibacter sp. AN1015 TaxID=3133428 RepID=UPI0030C21ACE